MGSQFAIVYDILIAVVLVFAIFSGAKRGFVSAVVGIAAVFVGFFCAMTFSAPLTELVYTSMVEKPLTEAVSQTLDDNMSSITLSGLSGMDFDSVKISGTPVSEITPDYSGTDKVVIDLSNVDLSGTGFESADLSKFGFGSSEDYAHMNGKTAEFTMADINAYGLGKLATAQVIAVKLAASPMISGIQEYVGIIGGLFPAQFQDISQGISDGEISMVRSLVLTMIDCSSSVKSAVIDHMLRPAFTLVMKTIFFAVIFIVVSCVLDIVARLLRWSIRCRSSAASTDCLAASAELSADLSQYALSAFSCGSSLRSAAEMFCCSTIPRLIRLSFSGISTTLNS